MSETPPDPPVDRELEAKKSISKALVGEKALIMVVAAIVLAIAREWLFALLCIGVAVLWWLTTWVIDHGFSLPKRRRT